MISRLTRLRWRRRIRRSKNQVEDIGIKAEDNVDQYFFRRLSKFTDIRRFVITWILLIVILIGSVGLQTRALSNYYMTEKPVAGGTFTEGMVGLFTNSNPIYATGSVDTSVSRLLYAGLLKYDSKNKLVGDLAESWKQGDNEKVYLVTLKKNLKWSDGKALTAKDVEFTYKTIQDPSAKSPLMASWQGIRISTVDKSTIKFELPNSLSSFQHSLTTGIIPQHVLGKTPVAQLRATRFNTTSPVGSGPFVWDALEIVNDTVEHRRGLIGLKPNQQYHQGAPKLNRFVVSFFALEKDMLDSFNKREVTAMSGIDVLPDFLREDKSIQQYSVPLTAQVMVFFRTSQDILSDIKVRQALSHAVNQSELLQNIGYPLKQSTQPFLKNQVGYDPSFNQLGYDVTQANKLLDEAGWKMGKDGVRVKGDKKLTFKLNSQSTSEYAYVSQRLQSDWQKVGAKVEVLLQSDSELQGTIAYHSYDALLYGISLGPDPDVYAYWGSSQADQRASNRVNFSEYKSTTADKALEGGRTRNDPALRAVKYRPFLEAWRNDAPAIALYRPRYLYISHDKINGFDSEIMNVPSDRYTNVVNWMIKTKKVSR